MSQHIEPGKTVLVVEDDVELRLSLCAALEEEGYCAAAAADGAEALAYLRTAPAPCIILLDLMMPNVNGWQFRAQQKGDPVLSTICTAIMTANANVKQTPIDADHFLWKPVRFEQVLAVIELCCGKP
jgi:CheY-like chemotaxis protein